MGCDDLSAEPVFALYTPNRRTADSADKACVVVRLTRRAVVNNVAITNYVEPDGVIKIAHNNNVARISYRT